MNLSGATVLVLGGAGLVGQAVCRELLKNKPATILLGAMTEAEARDGVLTLGTVPSDIEIVPIWGNLFVRAQDAFDAPGSAEAAAAWERRLSDDLDELTDEMYYASHLVQLVLGACPLAPGKRPDAVIDAVNTATALAYSGIYGRLKDVLKMRHSASKAALGDEVDGLLAAFGTPRLVRHVQLLGRALVEAQVQSYVKVGTTGTGGMGLNVPYTHGEERPSRVLLTKSAMAGAHSMLLFLLGRTPGAPAVAEIKPAAAITWKRIAFGPIRLRGRDVRLFDCRPGSGLRLEPGTAFQLDGAGEPLPGVLESVFVDTGENGLFSLAEYATVTSLGQMEAVTPEEIARLVVRELRGQSTGRNIVAALDGAVTPPSYRAGALRHHALAEGKRLAQAAGVPSIAFELLGPPRLSKLLYEAELLRLAFGSLDAVAAAEPDAIADAMVRSLNESDDVRRAAISVGIPVLMPDGHELLCAGREMAPHRWEQPGWVVDADAIERWAHSEWVDLRAANAARWRERATRMVAERGREATDTLRGSSLDRRFAADEFDIGAAAAWILVHEDNGYRV
jgi:NAD(P)-dependent dehydrogenase (short-subunit alcohol dehydrogenase family)